MSFTTFVLRAFGWATTYFLFFMTYKRFSRKWRIPLPPCPPADPIIGHLRKVPPAHAEVTYLEWPKKYGEVIYLNLLGRHIIVLNSKEAAYDLLDKRSALYSDRPDMIVWGLLAQEQIDRVVGNERLPTFEDRASLPYIECVVREILRWNPIFPLGVVHRSVQDNVYKGMFISKGSLVFPNVLAMSLDEDDVDPTTFNPSRFMPKSDGGGGESPFTLAFGFGRRICSGRHLAYASLWITVATIFSTLHISRKKDEDGHDIELQLEFGSNITNHPKPLPCDIPPRSETAIQLVKDAIRNIQAS